MKRSVFGVLAFQGDVAEHARALEAAAAGQGAPIEVHEVRTKEDVQGLAGLVIPGGESTTLAKLCEREGMFPAMRHIPAIFGTCAGAIMLAKDVRHRAPEQKTLGLMDITADRNAYGRQVSSFEEDIDTALGHLHAVFIRAPRIVHAGKNVLVLAEKDGEILACEERARNKYYLAAAFHPELTTDRFHAHFLKNAHALLARAAARGKVLPDN